MNKVTKITSVVVASLVITGLFITYIVFNNRVIYNRNSENNDTDEVTDTVDSNDNTSTPEIEDPFEDTIVIPPEDGTVIGEGVAGEDEVVEDDPADTIADDTPSNAPIETFTIDTLPGFNFEYRSDWDFESLRYEDDPYQDLFGYELVLSKELSTVRIYITPTVIGGCGGTNFEGFDITEISSRLNEFKKFNELSYSEVPLCPTGFYYQSNLPTTTDSDYQEMIDNASSFIDPELTEGVYFDLLVTATTGSAVHQEEIREMVRSIVVE